MTSELYPVLRSARDASFNYGNPLGGSSPSHLITFHNAIKDLTDIRPAIHDDELQKLVDAVLNHPASGIAGGVDPERFIAIVLPNSTQDYFIECAQACATALERCQSLRKGVH